MGNLTAPGSVQKLQNALHAKAKAATGVSVLSSVRQGVRSRRAGARLLGHRQTKGAGTDKPDRTQPRHILYSTNTMLHSKRERLFLLGLCLSFPACGLLAFFLAGAVVFPVVEPYYATRVFVSLGLMSIVYGLESVFGWGVIETCGLLSGNCTTHNLYPYAIQLWYWLVGLSLACLVGLMLLTRKNKAKPENT